MHTLFEMCTSYLDFFFFFWTVKLRFSMALVLNCKSQYVDLFSFKSCISLSFSKMDIKYFSLKLIPIFLMHIKYIRAVKYLYLLPLLVSMHIRSDDRNLVVCISYWSEEKSTSDVSKSYQEKTRTTCLSHINIPHVINNKSNLWRHIRIIIIHVWILRYNLFKNTKPLLK